MTLGVIYIICLVFGTPANFLSFLYFMKRKTGAATNKTYMIHLYRMITFIDILLCFLLFPIIEALFASSAEETRAVNLKNKTKSEKGLNSPSDVDGNSRQKSVLLFEAPTFCIIWGLLWNILPVLSVFLVAILSFSRCLLLLYPLKKLDIRKPIVFLTAATLLMFSEKLVAIYVYPNVSYRYQASSLKACYILSDKKNAAESPYDSAQSFLFLVLLGFPVILILGSFIASLYKLRVAQQKEANLRSNEKSKHREAAITVIIVTAIYIFCNIPVLVCHVYYAADIIKDFKENGIPKINKSHENFLGGKGFNVWRDSDKVSVIMVGFLLSVSYILLVAVNSCLNPLVYFTRMKEFRDSSIKQKSKILRFFRKTDRNSRVCHFSQEIQVTANENLSNEQTDWAFQDMIGNFMSCIIV